MVRSPVVVLVLIGRGSDGLVSLYHPCEQCLQDALHGKRRYDHGILSHCEKKARVHELAGP